MYSHVTYKSVLSDCNISFAKLFVHFTLDFPMGHIGANYYSMGEVFVLVGSLKQLQMTAWQQSVVATTHRLLGGTSLHHLILAVEDLLSLCGSYLWIFGAAGCHNVARTTGSKQDLGRWTLSGSVLKK